MLRQANSESGKTERFVGRGPPNKRRRTRGGGLTRPAVNGPPGRGPVGQDESANAMRLLYVDLRLLLI